MQEEVPGQQAENVATVTPQLDSMDKQLSFARSAQPLELASACVTLNVL